MEENALNLIYSNRDAIATNRGFYFQYLSLLKKWVQNYIQGNDNILHSEVGDDIRELGDKLVFTQLKCYSSSFSLNSKEIKKALYIFFLNYLREKADNPELSFVFETNTRVAKAEKLLQSWIAEYPLANGELRQKCSRRVGIILLEELNRAQRSKLEAAGKDPERLALTKAAYLQLKEELTEQQLSYFTSAIRWGFMEQSPEVSIGVLSAEIHKLLSHKAFEGRPANVLMKVLLSEIYRCSQNSEINERELSNRTIKNILQETDVEFFNHIDERITVLFQEYLDSIHEKIEGLRSEQLFHAEKLEKLDQKVNRQEKIRVKPKELTIGPVLHTTDLINRPQEVQRFHQFLSEQSHVAINGPGGLGKSTLLKFYYQEFYDHYDHVLWLDADLNVLDSMRLNEGLCTNLGIEIAELADTVAVTKVIHALNEIQGNNILLIDNCNNDVAILDQLCRMRNWKVLASSRMLLKNFYTHKLSLLNFDQARMLFEKFVDTPTHESELQDFFDLVDYNTLLIEIAAKTIQNSLDLDLKEFLGYFKDQQLDVLDLEIDIELEGSRGNIQLFTFLENTFKLSGLTDEEQNLLDFLALLPSEVDINDLVDIAGAEFRKANTQFFINTITHLSQKGWLEREKNKVKIHRLIQETSIYRQRKGRASFQSSMFLLTWLIRRFEEGFLNAASTSLRFYKYGLSILNAIKEPYRENLYQPLLRLENEVLYVDNLLISNEDTCVKWKDLEQRAVSYLPATDPFLGVIRLNLAMSLFKQGADTEGINFCLLAIAVFKKNLPVAIQPLLTVMTNLSIIYSQNYKFKDVMNLMKEMMEIRQKYKLKNDPTVPALSNALALAHQRSGNLDKATSHFKMGIKMHLELDKMFRNDAHLVLMINNLSINLFIESKYEDAITNQYTAVKLVEKIGLYNTKLFRETLDTLYSFYTNLDRIDEAEELKERYLEKYF